MNIFYRHTLTGILLIAATAIITAYLACSNEAPKGYKKQVSQQTQDPPPPVQEQSCHIEVYSGLKIKEWNSVNTPTGDNTGMNFVDRSTGKSVYISGGLIIIEVN